jgi:hypothetical protein
MTETDIYNSLVSAMGVRSLDKDQARVALKHRIKQSPSWVCVLPETLLDKLGIRFDHQFDNKDITLAAAINGQLARRIFYAK